MRFIPLSTNRIIKYGLVIPLWLVLVVSLVFSAEYSKAQSITDVSKFTTQSDTGTEEEPTIKDDMEEEETREDDVPEVADEEDNDTVTSVPPKQPAGSGLGIDDLSPIEERVDEKVIFASCKKNFLTPFYGSQISCTVPGAAPGDNVFVTRNIGGQDGWCNFIVSSHVSKHNVVDIIFYDAYLTPYGGETPVCADVPMKGFVTFSIIVFRPETTSQGIVD